MKNITLSEALKILQDCSAIIFDDNALIYPSLSDLENDADNEFMYISWEEDSMEYSTKFAEGQNQIVKISNSAMFLVDTEGEECKITILEEKGLEK